MNVTTTEIEATILQNPVLRQVRAMYRENGEVEKIEVLERQTLKGVLKYGHSVDYKEKTVDEWEQFRLEEVVDGDVYAVAKVMREHFDWEQKRKYEAEKQAMAQELMQVSAADRADILNQLASKYNQTQEEK